MNTYTVTDSLQNSFTIKADSMESLQESIIFMSKIDGTFVMVAFVYRPIMVIKIS